MSAFVAGSHTYALPVQAGIAGGRRRSEWSRALELTPDDARTANIDVVVFQRLDELEAVRQWIGERRIPAVYVEHNTPQGRINEMRHPLADRADIVIVHVTHFNALYWDTGTTRTRVIEHGIPDPGYLFSGELPRAAVVINEAQRRARVTGTDLLPRFAQAAPIDLFGIGSGRDIPQRELHAEMAKRRFYLHPYRWTSLGLSLLEAMLVGMPVVALATTEAPLVVTAERGICTNDLDAACEAIRWLLDDPQAAARLGRAGRAHVLARYSLTTFLAAWDQLLAEVVAD